MTIESMMPSNHLILCCPLLFLPSIFPSIRVFSNESALHIRWPKYWSFSFNNERHTYGNRCSFHLKCNQSLPKLITERWILNKSKPSHETRRQPRALRQSGSRAPSPAWCPACRPHLGFRAYALVQPESGHSVQVEPSLVAFQK